jgi:hypothetical protein
MRRVHRVSALLLVAGGLLVLPAGAGAATVTVSPTSLVFGGQAAGTTSAAQQVTLTKDCTGANQTNCLGPPAEGPTFNTSISAPAPFLQTNNCPGSLTASPLPDPGTKVSCTINVTFAPTTQGNATGTLLTGAGGPTVSLMGTGTPPQSSAGTKKKKCKKKKKGASAAKKKCKKKKSG